MKITSHTTLVVTKGGKPQDIAPNTPVDIDDDEARDLIERGLAVKAAKAETPAPEKLEKTDPAKPNSNSGNGNGQKNDGKQP
jgi:hypothetical protein